MGPDSKIYATVPKEYKSATGYLDVISNPEETGILVNYQEDAINLGTGRATQGLPPFISSIFAPIEIRGDDGSGNTILLNDQKLDICLGVDLTIKPESSSGNATYEWSFNKKIVSTYENLTLTYVDTSNIGDYKLEVTTIDDCGRKAFKQGFFTINSISPPPKVPNHLTPQIICDNNYTGTYEFNFEELYSETILDGQSPSEFEVLYFKSEDDAINNVNPLPVPFNSPNITVHARIHNINNADCFNTTSFDVNIFQSALPLESENITPLIFCDNTSIGTDTDGFILFNLDDRKNEILTRQSESDFEVTYFEDDLYSIPITNYTSYQNSISGGQTIYVKVTNKLESSCFAETSFQIEVTELPTAPQNFIYKNCDEDEISDGFTDFNLNEIETYLTDGNSDLDVTYHKNWPDANSNSNPINPLPYNNSSGNTIYARVATPNNCYRITTIDLQVSTTSSNNINFQTLQTCDDDEFIDGLYVFNLSSVSDNITSQLPSGQNLTVKFYRTENDALLEVNEIVDQENYQNETAFNQTLYVRIESENNGECFGIGPYLKLVVHPRPEFEFDSNATVCTNLPPITLETYNAKGNYTYTWTDENGTIVSTLPTAEISKGGTYSVVASSTDGNFCESFPQTIDIIESTPAIINLSDITVTDDSNNNTITINNDFNNLGNGKYEFSLNDEYGIYKETPMFENVLPGNHILYVRDQNNCGTTTLEISIIGFPKFFTPNNDGQNDFWRIIGLDDEFYTVSTIYIYNRFGKKVAQINPEDQGWNGYYNGIELPSDDYWFSTELTDKDGVSKIKKGHFSLIRR